MATTTVTGLRNDLVTGSTLPASEVNAHADTLEWIAAGQVTIDAGGSGSTALSETEYENHLLVLSGTLAGSRTLVFPLHAGRRWWVYNNTSGAFPLTVQGSSGTGVTVTQGYRSLVACDGTNFVRLDGEISGSTDNSLRTVSPRVVTGIHDANGNEAVRITATASAVNDLTVVNAATANRPRIDATGDDTHISLELRGKGTGGIAIGSGGTPIVKVLSAATTWDPGSIADGAVTSTTLTVTGAAAGNPVFASHDQIGGSDVLVSAHVQSANTVRVVVQNRTGGVLDLASGILRAVVFQF